MSSSRRSCMVAAIVAATLGSASPGLAAERVPFDQSRFAAAQEAGKPILVDIAASWCPTCQAQKPIISEIMAKSEYATLVVFQVDFDSQKDVVRRFGARLQSTLIVFKGRREVARSVGDSERRSIERLIGTAFDS